MIGAVVQAGSVIFNQPRCLDKIDQLTHEAASNGANLVVFPEAFVSGYPRGVDFGAPVGSRTEEGREAFRLYWDSAVDVPGPAVDHLSCTAKRNSVELVVGVIERDGGTLYCCVLFFGADGTFRGKHRKLMPTASERLLWGFGDGSTMPVFDTPVGRIGAVICWENYMPLMRYAMYAKNIQIYCAPTADNRETWISSMRHIALEGRCFVLSCNQFTRRRDFPSNLGMSTDLEPNDVVSAGGSCIIDPFGTVLAGPNWEDETILYAELDMDQIPRGKYDFDCVGHYSRSDIFQLRVDARPKTPTEVIGDTTANYMQNVYGGDAHDEQQK